MTEEQQVPANIHESVKEDFKIELTEVEIQNKAYRSFISDIAKMIGTTQETEPIRARINTLVEKETKLQNIKDNRPLSKNPFEGLGNKAKDLFDNMNNLIKLLIKKHKK